MGSVGSVGDGTAESDLTGGAGMSGDVDLAGTPRARPTPTMGALEV